MYSSNIFCLPLNDKSRSHNKMAILLSVALVDYNRHATTTHPHKKRRTTDSRDDDIDTSSNPQKKNKNNSEAPPTGPVQYRCILKEGEEKMKCAARKTKFLHNFENSYFIVDKTKTKHGEKLYCSNIECRNTGVKFKYCAVCKIPVALQNFGTRHKHEGHDITRLHKERKK
mmetsp:Transcript_17282/g.39002  ORF Transcript_17282/g.39002 Transcript_17282/m.39002 type:complete len:171 (-) Transcript_17282:276-788(-)